jgi:hypothetical protein
LEREREREKGKVRGDEKRPSSKTERVEIQVRV